MSLTHKEKCEKGGSHPPWGAFPTFDILDWLTQIITQRPSVPVCSACSITPALPGAVHGREAWSHTV